MDNKKYLEILKATQGILHGKVWDKREKERHKLELAAAKRRKQAW